MMKFYKGISVLPFVLLIAGDVGAQLAVSTGTSPSQLAQQVTGNGVDISNASIDCHNNSFGTYSGSGTNLGSQGGIILSTGDAQSAAGINNSGQVSGEMGTAGSQLITTASGKVNYDACTFSFDVSPKGNTLVLDYIFASEEYEEWVGSAYNDEFGIFISGPGITGEQRISLVPGSTSAAAINTINSTSNSQYYTSNTGGTSVQFDGFTKKLSAIATVTPCQTYRITIAIADGNDRLWDSGLFLEKVSSTLVGLSAATQGNIPYMVEGCNNGSVTFTRGAAAADALTVYYYLGGTASNGTDYTQVGSSTTPMTLQSITIPANQASASLSFQAVADNTTEGQENVIVYLVNPGCNNQVTDSISIYIKDNLEVSLSPSAGSICKGENVQLTAVAEGTFTWSPTAGLSGTSILNPVASPDSTTTYQLTVSAAGCTATRSSTISVSDLKVKLESIQVKCNGETNGSINLTNQKGLAPYTYSWTGPNGFASSSEDLANIAAGTYTVVVNDAGGCTVTSAETIKQPAPLTITINKTDPNTCPAHNGKATVIVSGGTAPYTFVWEDGSTDRHRKNMTEGTYQVSVTDAIGCTQVAEVTLVAPPTNQSVQATVSSTNVTCYGGNNGTATVTLTGGSGNTSYTWSNGATTPTISALSAGFYSVTIKRPNGCSKVLSVYITQPPAFSITKTQTNVSCFGKNDGTSTVAVAGGTAPYTYSWNTTPAQTGATASGLTAGTYSVAITDSKGCTTSASFTITQPQALTAAVSSQTNVLCKGNSTGSAAVTTAGGTAPYSYSWNTNPASSSATASSLAAGTYSAVVTDAKGCTAAVPVTITEPAQALSASLSKTDALCMGGNGTATATVSGGVAPYSYSWNSNPVQTSAAATLSAGSYTCSVTDANNCRVALPVTIAQPQQLSAVIASKQDVLCFGNATGSATAAVTGGAAPYSYSWSTTPAQTAATASGLSAGTYSVTVKDANNCTSTATVTISQPTAPLTANITDKVNVLCKGAATGSATVMVNGGKGGYSYSWSASPAQTSPVATGLAAGTYTVAVADQNNCQLTQTVTITEPAQPLAAAVSSKKDVSCAGSADGAITVTATGGSGSYSYSWNTTPAQFTPAITNLTQGNYSITVRDNNGCPVSVSAIATITEPAAAVGSAFTTSSFNGFNISCHGKNDGSINLTATGGTPAYSFKWSGPQGFTAASEDISNVYAGTYSVIITDVKGCKHTQTITLTEPAPVAVTYTMTPATCPNNNDGRIDISNTAVGTYSYSWAGPNGFTSNNRDISNLIPGTYTLTISNTTHCSFIAIEVTKPGNLTMTSTLTNVTCNGGSNGAIAITTSGGNPTYSWQGPNGFTSSAEDISGVMAGTYTVTATNNNGCFIARSFTLAEPPAIEAAFTVSSYSGYGVSCKNGNNGSITAAVSGGAPGYQYSWTGPNGFTSTSLNLTGLSAGNYVLTVRDASSCSRQFTVAITEPSPLTITPDAEVFAGGYNIRCNNTSTGEITAIVTGGHPSYAYSWSGPNGFSAASPTIDNLRAGAYTLSVTDMNGCTASQVVNLSEPAPLTASASSPLIQGFNIICNGSATGSITSTVNGGSGNYYYSWSGPGGFVSANDNMSGLYAGTYSLTVTDLNGCSANTSVSLIEPPVLNIALSSATVNGGYNISCYGGTAPVNATVTGGNPAYTYSWSGPAVSGVIAEDIPAAAAGAYTLTVTDRSGCTGTASLTITQPSQIASTVTTSQYNGGNQVSCAGKNDGSIDVTISGGTLPYSYNWTGANGLTSSSEDISLLTAGQYSVTVTDANSCAKNISVVLSEPSPLAAAASLSQYNGYNISCSGGTNGAIDLSVSGGTQPYSYNWSTGATAQDLGSIPAGTYSVTVLDANSCAATVSVTLTQPAPLAASTVKSIFAGNNNVSCAGASDGSIALSVTGGTSPLAFSWTGPSGFISNIEDLDSLKEGSYTADITDANGCTITASVTLVQPDQLSVGLTSPVFNNYNIACNGDSTGAISAFVNGGTPGRSYSWSGPSGFASSSRELGQLVAGTYSLTVTDTNGCTASSSIALTQPEPIASSLTASQYGAYNISCFGMTNGNVGASATGGVAPYAFFWAGPNALIDSVAAIANLGAGNYEVYITDANNCMATRSITLTEPPLLSDSIGIALYAGGYHIKCKDGSDGTISLNISGGSSPYTATWSGPSGFTSSALTGISNVKAGRYAVQVIDANQCILTDSIVLTEPPVLNVALTKIDVSCKGDSTGTITADISGGTPVYTHSWNGARGFISGIEDISKLIAGTYSITVTDANGCIAAASVGIDEPMNALSASAAAAIFNGSNISCYNSKDGSIDLTIDGGTPVYSSVWRGPAGYTASAADVSGLAAGTYEVSIFDSKGCNTDLSISLTQPDSLILSNSVSSFNGNNISCHNAKDGYIQLELNGGTQPYSYGWTGSSGFVSNAEDIASLDAGTYSVTATDANGCVISKTFTLTQPSALIAGASARQYNNYNVSCFGKNDGKIELGVSGATPGYTCTWSGPGNFSSSLMNIDSLAAGGYTYKVQDANGCSITSTVNLVQPEKLTVEGEISTPTCYGFNNGVIDINVAGGNQPYTFGWSNGASAKAIANIPAGTYSVTVTDANGCAVTGSYSVTSPQPIAVTNSISQYSQYNISCHGKSDGFINLGVSGGKPGYAYSWSGPNGFTSGAASLTGIPAGTYSLVIADANACVYDQAFTLNQPASPVQTVSASSFGAHNVSCKGSTNGSINFDVQGGAMPWTYSWSGPGTFTSASEDLSQLTAGSYSVTAKDANGCTVNASLTLTEPEELKISGSSQSPACAAGQDGAISIDVAGGSVPYSFNWSDGSLTEDRPAIGAGTYSITVTDAFGCSAISSFSLTEPAALSLTTNVASPFCSSDRGAIDLGVQGGSRPYSYVWSNGSTAEDAASLAPGTYSVTVTDGNGCQSAVSATITAGAEVTITSIVNGVNCYGDATGSIDVTADKGAEPYTFTWSNGMTTEDVSSLSAGTYSLTVSDLNGCKASASFEVGQSPKLAAACVSPAIAGPHHLSGFQSNDGSIDLTVNGGTEPYSFYWTNGSQDEDLAQLAAGTYSVTVTDAKGCRVMVSAQLTQPLPLQMPTGFSPNGDGKNDNFVVHGIEAFPNNEIVILNRWGNEVYKTNGYNNDWQGQNNAGEPLPDGTYFVIITINDPSITLKGYVDMRR